MKNMEGQRVPDVVFKVRQGSEWRDVTTDEIFKGKKVVVFGLPGAFTPTCSTAHVPRYNELAPAFKENGIDDIVCISVNDCFVMGEWQRQQGASNITFIPDGNGAFSEGMSMLVDKKDLGFGKRSWRYSMLVDDGIIKKMFVEPDKPGDPFEVSDADTMLSYINPHAEKPLRVTMFTKAGCPYCARAKEMLHDRKIGFEEIQLGGDVTTKSLENVTGRTSTPQVFIDGEHIGGSDDLEKWLEERSQGGESSARATVH